MKAKSLALALALLWVTGAGAAQDFNGTTSDRAATAVAEVTAAPFTFACWGNADTAAPATGMTAISVNRNNTDTQGFTNSWLGNVAGDPISAVASGGGTTARADTSTGYSASTWHHGASVFASTTSRSAYIDGGSKTTNTTSVTPASINETVIAGADLGGIGAASNPYDGRLAECGIWNVALTDDEIATLAKGFAPPCVRRASLVAYYPMVRDTTSLKDLFSATANNLTLTGTNAVADHPRILNCN